MITVNANEEYIPSLDVNVIANQPSISSYYQARYNITKEDLKLLSESPVVNIKMIVGDGSYQSEVKKRRSKKILHNAYCIIQ